MKEVENFPEYIDFPVNKCLMTGEPEKILKAQEKLRELFGEKLNIFRSEPFFLEFMPSNIDKAYSLQKLLNYLDCEKSQMICCGDGFNDLTMIQYAGLGVAMEKAQPEVKKEADFITYSNDADGIAHVIETFMLKPDRNREVKGWQHLEFRRIQLRYYKNTILIFKRNLDKIF